MRGPCKLLFELFRLTAEHFAENPSKQHPSGILAQIYLQSSVLPYLACLVIVISAYSQCFNLFYQIDVTHTHTITCEANYALHWGQSTDAEATMRQFLHNRIAFRLERSWIVEPSQKRLDLLHILAYDDI